MDLPDPRTEQGPPALQVDSLPTELSGKPQALETMGQVRKTRHPLIVVLNCLAVTRLQFSVLGEKLIYYNKSPPKYTSLSQAEVYFSSNNSTGVD